MPTRSLPDSWPLTLHPTFPLTPSPSLHIQNLDILFGEADLTPGYRSSYPLGPSLAAFLFHTKDLTSLSLRGSERYGISDLTPTLTNLSAPPLPFLKDLSIEYIKTDANTLLALTIPNKNTLEKLGLKSIALKRGTWAEVGSVFGKEMGRLRGLEWVRMRGLGYLDEDGEWRDFRDVVEDRQVWGW